MTLAQSPRCSFLEPFRVVLASILRNKRVVIGPPLSALLAACAQGATPVAASMERDDEIEGAKSQSEAIDAAVLAAPTSTPGPTTTANVPPRPCPGGVVGSDGRCSWPPACPCESGLCVNGFCVFVPCSSAQPCEVGICGPDAVCSARFGRGRDVSCLEDASLGDCEWREITADNSGGLIRDLCEDGELLNKLRRCDGTCMVPDNNYAGFAVAQCSAAPESLAADEPGLGAVVWDGYSCCPR